MTEHAVEKLREKARDYELNALAAKERGDAFGGGYFAAIAITLFEVADVLEAELAEAA